MFSLTTKSAYGLNLLITLAQAKKRMPLRSVAVQTGMPYRFLTKIVRSLIVSGLIIAKEGKDGGYVLTRKPEQINLRQIFEALNEPINTILCQSSKGCPLGKGRGCKMKPVWLKIKKNIDKQLEEFNLREIL